MEKAHHSSCETCSHFKYKSIADTHCYMFKEKPNKECIEHTDRTRITMYLKSLNTITRSLSK